MVFYHTVLPGTPLHLRKKLNLHFEHNSKNQLQTSQRRLVHVHNTSLDSPARADKWSIWWLYGDHRWWVGLCVSWGETATSQPCQWTVKPVGYHWEWIKTLSVIIPPHDLNTNLSTFYYHVELKHHHLRFQSSSLFVGGLLASEESEAGSRSLLGHAVVVDEKCSKIGIMTLTRQHHSFKQDLNMQRIS